MNKLMILSTNRADFSHLYMTVRSMKESSVHTVFTAAGSHFDETRGASLSEIVKEGIKPDNKIRLRYEWKTSAGLNRYLSSMRKRLRTVIRMTGTDMIMVLGDRIELLPVIDLSLTENIRLVHISGGERTEGAIDDRIRNMLTVNADINFTSSDYFADNVRKFAKPGSITVNAGDPALELIDSIDIPGRHEMSFIPFKKDSQYALLTFHPETAADRRIGDQTAGLIKYLENTDMNILCTAPNNDIGSEFIMKHLHRISSKRANIAFIEHLGFRNYIAALKYAEFAVGNSSSLIIEAPYLKTPSVLIGIRQKGRPLAESVFQSDYDFESIAENAGKAMNKDMSADIELYYERKDTSKIIREVLEKSVL